MTVKKKPTISPKIIKNAKQVLAFAQEKARTCENTNEVFNAIFSPTGKATELFPTESERAAFLRTKEVKAIYKLIQALPYPPVKEIVDFQPNGNFAITLRFPKSLYEALLRESESEGVSLDQLCLTKLAAQLRDVV